MMSNTLKEIFTLFGKRGCDISSPKIQLKVSCILRDYIVDQSKTKSIPLRQSFAEAVRQLAWQSPAALFDQPRGEYARWGKEQYRIMKEHNDEVILSCVAEWAKTKSGSLEPVRELIARNYVYFRDNAEFQRITP